MLLRAAERTAYRRIAELLAPSPYIATTNRHRSEAYCFLGLGFGFPGLGLGRGLPYV
jgi:hypothetical protein